MIFTDLDFTEKSESFLYLDHIYLNDLDKRNPKLLSQIQKKCLEKSTKKINSSPISITKFLYYRREEDAPLGAPLIELNLLKKR